MHWGLAKKALATVAGLAVLYLISTAILTYGIYEAIEAPVAKDPGVPRDKPERLLYFEEILEVRGLTREEMEEFEALNRKWNEDNAFQNDK